MSASPVRDNELLGRRISEGKTRPPKRHKRIRENIRARGERGISKQIIPAREFKPKMGETDLSVDRVDEAPREHVANVAERDATSDGRIFYGWAVVSREQAAQMNRIVRASPIENPPNPYHADIVFPDSVKDDEDERTSHAQNLAENAEWLEWREREICAHGARRPKLRVT